MNFFLLKNVILIAGILGTTAIAAGPVQNMISGASGENMSADSVYQFGSGLFFKEINKPGNEYLQSSVEGYSQSLIQDDRETASFDEEWQQGISTFKAGYSECNEGYLMLTTIPGIRDQKGKNAPWEMMRAGREDIARSAGFFRAAKSHASPGSSLGFTIGMVLPRIDEIGTSAGDAELAGMKATLADRDHDTAGFEGHLREAGAAIREMKRIYPELRVLSKDF